MCQTSEEIEAEIAEGFRQIEEERKAAEDAAYQEHLDSLEQPVDDEPEENDEEYEPTEVYLGEKPGGLRIYE